MSDTRRIPVLNMRDLSRYARAHGWLSWTLRTVGDRWFWVRCDADGNVVENEKPEIASKPL